MKHHLALTLSLTLAALITPLRGDELEDLKKAYYGLPLIASDDGMMLPVKVDDHEAVMLVDSGATSMTFDAKLAEKWGLKITDAKGETKGVGGSQKRRYAHFEKLALGGTIPLGGITKVHCNKLHEKGTYRHGDQDLQRIGIIGLGILKQFGAVIDFKHARLLIPRGKEQKPLAEIMEGAVAIPLRSTNMHYIPAVVAGHETELVLDSGASDLIINGLFCKKHKIEVRPTEGKAVGFAGKEVPVGRAKIGKLSIGKSITLEMDELSCFDFDDVHGERGGLLGYKLLRQLNAVYDMGKGVIYVRR